MTPHSLGEIYSFGKTAKEWAKTWVKDKGLGDCGEAREIIPSGAALDAIFLIDETPGAINQVGTEKLVRKVFGIKMAYKDVQKEADWKKGPKTKTKVDYELWRRIDPSREEQEHAFVNRKVETELRSEMERDASMLKARAKLAEAQKSK